MYFLCASFHRQRTLDGADWSLEPLGKISILSYTVLVDRPDSPRRGYRRLNPDKALLTGCVSLNLSDWWELLKKLIWMWYFALFNWFSNVKCQIWGKISRSQNYIFFALIENRFQTSKQGLDQRSLDGPGTPPRVRRDSSRICGVKLGWKWNENGKFLIRVNIGQVRGFKRPWNPLSPAGGFTTIFGLKFGFGFNLI